MKGFLYFLLCARPARVEGSRHVAQGVRWGGRGNLSTIFPSSDIPTTYNNKIARDSAGFALTRSLLCSLWRRAKREASKKAGKRKTLPACVYCMHTRIETTYEHQAKTTNNKSATPTPPTCTNRT